MKTCKKCGESKPLFEFYVHKMMADGHLNFCKPCVRNGAKSYREKNIERIRAYDRERGKLNARIAKSAEQTKAWRAADPRRLKCHNAVARALRKGALVKRQCQVCGADAVAHHESYDRPLDVTWLCTVHHKKRHKEMAILGINP